MRIAWLSDIHLNFVQPEYLRGFLDLLAGERLDGLLVGGDVAEAPSLVRWLNELAEAVPCPIWFVLGNHDFYHGSIAGVTADVLRLCAARPRLTWLTHADPLPLTGDTVLVGEDGWGDARFGHPTTTPVMLNDFMMIAELVSPGRAALIERLNRLGDEAAARLRPRLATAIVGARHVVVLTHVPPWRESAWHEGRASDDDWAPFFACQATGEVIMHAAVANPGVRFTVLCGHTHGAGEWRPLPNLEVLTAGAVYGEPVVQRVLTVDRGP